MKKEDWAQILHTVTRNGPPGTVFPKLLAHLFTTEGCTDVFS